MKAIVYKRYGPPGVLAVDSADRPIPNDDEVLIKIHAAEATKADCELRSFRFAVNWFWLPLRLALGITAPRRKILGGYFAGEVVETGANVTEPAIGDEIFGAAGLRMGAYGEFLALPASATVIRKPHNMSFVEAAAVPLGGLNALHFMRLANVKPGEKVLINGAGGSIGAHALQIAKANGAEVTAVDSGIKENMLRAMGADDFVDYVRESFVSKGQVYDVVFDMVAGSSYSDCMKVLKNDGRYLSGNPRLSTMLRSVVTTRFTDRTARFAFAGETREELRTLKAMVEDDSIRSIVDKTFPMHQAADAHRLVESEQRLGAIVIEMDAT